MLLLTDSSHTELNPRNLRSFGRATALLDSFTLSLSLRVGLPLPWHEAARIPGALDAGSAWWVFETFGLGEVEPLTAPEISAEIRIAERPQGDILAAYAPCLTEIAFRRDLSRHEAVLVNLADRSVLRPVLRHGRGGDRPSLYPL
jgi:hypothetical protein